MTVKIRKRTELKERLRLRQQEQKEEFYVYNHTIPTVLLYYIVVLTNRIFGLYIKEYQDLWSSDPDSTLVPTKAHSGEKDRTPTGRRVTHDTGVHRRRDKCTSSPLERRYRRKRLFLRSG